MNTQLRVPARLRCRLDPASSGPALDWLPDTSTVTLIGWAWPYLGFSLVAETRNVLSVAQWDLYSGPEHRSRIELETTDGRVLTRYFDYSGYQPGCLRASSAQP